MVVDYRRNQAQYIQDVGCPLLVPLYSVTQGVL